MAEVEGVHLRITGDSSQAVRELEKLKKVAADWAIQKNFDTSKMRSFAEYFQKQLATGFSGLDTIGRNLEGVFGGFLRTITAGVTGITAALSGVAIKSLAIGGSFEAAMTSVKIISGATAEELEQLTKKAREMGATLPISATDAANAMTVMVQRGTSAKDTLASVEEVASFAISQSVNMATAADLIGATLKNFGLAVEETAKVANEFNIASNSSALNVSKLVESMKYVSPAAASVGASLEEALAAQMSLADSGLTGEMIGTGLAMIYSKLATKTRIMGVETKNLDGTMRPLKDIFTELQQKGFGLAEATTEFGQRGSKAALNLAKFSSTLEQNAQNLQKLGVTQAAVEEKMKSWPNVMNTFRSAMEELNIEIFEQIKEQSKDVVSSVATFTKVLSDWISKTKIAEKSLRAFLEGLNVEIPTGNDFKKLLERFNVEAFVEQMKNFGTTLRGIADSIVNFFSMVRAPLLFLIEHLDTFATISFWGWILGRGLQIPMAILNIANAFTQLRTALAALSVLNVGHIGVLLTQLLTLFTNPVFMGVGAGAGILLGLGLLGHGVHHAIEGSEISRNRINTWLEETKTFKEEFAKQQKEINETVSGDIRQNFKTGFEELPDDINKISFNLSKILDFDIEKLQTNFKAKIAEVFNEVTAGVSEHPLTVENITDSMAEEISKALQGSQEVFSALDPIMKKVVVGLYDMGVEAGKATGDISELIKQYRGLKEEISKSDPAAIFTDFREAISNNIDTILDDLPANIERMQNFIGSQNLELILNVSLDQARKSLEGFVKSASEKYSIPEEIISRGVFSRLQELATQGNKTSQALIDGWRNSTVAIDSFMQDAKDAVQYLGASPETFTPALEKLTSNIQRINPLTGKVTEQFKKAYAALKEWANVTFDKLAQRIQKLRKAFEGGFISKEALEAEYRRVTPQIKAQVVAELEPMKNQLSSSEYHSILASEYTSRLQDLGGDAFIDMWRKELSNLWSQSGQAIGAAIERQVKSTAQSQVSSYSQPAIVQQNFSQVITPLINKIEQLSTQNNQKSDYSGSMSLIVGEIKNVSSNLQNVRLAVIALENAIKAQQTPVDITPIVTEIKNVNSAVSTLIQNQDNVDTSEIVSAIQNVVDTLRALNVGNNFDIDINQEGFIIQDKSDANMLANATANVLRSGIGNGGL